MTYYLGLDMGTGSVGWAATDKNYKLIRAKGKDFWGVRLFQTAKTAAERRSHRVARLRRQREKVRIGYLKTIFSDAINKVDPGFFQRLDDSFFYAEDKNINQPYALFADTGYTDVDYYRDYPTIFHLRSTLIHDTSPKDVRLVYLAVLNMFKHRGHFLASNLSENGVDDFGDIYQQWCKSVPKPVQISDPEAKTEKIENILSKAGISNTRRLEALLEVFGIKRRDAFAEVLKLWCGLKGNLSKIWSETDFSDLDNTKPALSFKDSNLDMVLSQLEEILPDEDYSWLMLTKQIYDWSLLSGMMKDASGKSYDYLSDARVASYQKHSEDLKTLKRFYHDNHLSAAYDQMFRVMGKDNYSAYAGSVQSKKEVVRRGASCGIEELYKRIKKDLKPVPDCETKQIILENIERGTFLPKQLTRDNGVIPNQIHVHELKAILKNAENYLPFLKEGSELTNSEKILQLFQFQIPYYVGPLYSDENNYAWVVRKEGGRVFPWNFAEKVDEKASAEGFISELVARCTYLDNEKVLPKASLLYEKFMVLNELNNLRINGERISVDIKQELYQNLFTRGKKVTLKKVRDYLVAKGYFASDEEIDFSGVDDGFKNTLSSHQKFKEIFDVEVLNDWQKSMSEKIIFWATVYGDSKKFLKERLEDAYGNELDQKQIKRILGLRFKDWGRLSEAFLNLEGKNSKTNQSQTIIEALWNGDGTNNFNLMELLSSQFTYRDTLKKRALKGEKTLTNITYEDLSDLYLSPSVRRMVWQTILIVKELRQVLGAGPAKIFIEMARDVTLKAGTRTTSRRQQLLDLYKNVQTESRNWVEEIETQEESRFRSKKIFLYYTQMGQCMYTGEPIVFKDLFNRNLYDIDHIYPRHFVKDDSLINNLVLVKKQANSHKSDTFPIENSIQQARRDFWKWLSEKGLISREKFNRLTRRTSFSDEELAGFISRQIVETRQGTKAVAQIFENALPDSEVVYVKAGNVSDFRHHFNLLKCREINDLHHAQDAYLNVVVGNVYHTKFTKNPINFIKGYRKDRKAYAYHMDQIFDHPVKRNDIIAWQTDKNQSIATVKKVMAKGTPLVTRMSYEEHGELSNQNICSAKAAQKAEGKGYLPIKNSERLSNTQRYGGYNKYAGSYFFLVEHTLKKNRVRTIETMPLFLRDTIKTSKDLLKYCCESLKLEAPSIRVMKIKMGSLLSVNGAFVYLTGRSGKKLITPNGFQLILPQKWQDYIRLLIKTKDSPDDVEGISGGKNIEFYDILVEKHTKTCLKNRPNPIGEKLREWRNDFIALDNQKQSDILLEILKLTTFDNSGADLRAIGGKNQSGVSTIGKKISSQKSVVLVHRSVTGIFEKQVDLLSI